MPIIFRLFSLIGGRICALQNEFGYSKYCTNSIPDNKLLVISTGPFHSRIIVAPYPVSCCGVIGYLSIYAFNPLSPSIICGSIRKILSFKIERAASILVTCFIFTFAISPMALVFDECLNFQYSLEMSSILCLRFNVFVKFLENLTACYSNFAASLSKYHSVTPFLL